MNEDKHIEGLLKRKEEGKSQKGDTFWKLTVLDAGKAYTFFHWAGKFEIPLDSMIRVNYLEKPIPQGGMLKQTRNVTLLSGTGETKEARREDVQARMEKKVDEVEKEFKNGGDLTELDNRISEQAIIISRCYDAVTGILDGKKPQTSPEIRLVEMLYDAVRT